MLQLTAKLPPQFQLNSIYVKSQSERRCIVYIHYIHIHCTISNTDTFKRRLKTYLFCKFYDLAYPSNFM